MENAAYIGLSRQLTLRRELDIVANNIANADTTGFKVEHMMVSTEIGAKARNDMIRPSASFVMDKGIGRDFGQGALRQTGRSLDLAIEAEGVFFQIENGDTTAYTRDGAFTLNAEGVLSTQQGLPVLGDGGPITLDAAQGPATIGKDGTITQNGLPIGRLRVVRFEDMAVLAKAGNGLYINTSNQEPAEANDAPILQGNLEGSNVNSLAEITNLIEINRAYERISKMIDNQNDLSRRSVERLGRIS